VQAGDYFKTTPLICAIDQNKIEIVKVLLDKGADLEKRDEFGSTPLMAASGKSIEIVKLLLDRGADVNGRGTGFRNGWTSFMEAAAVGNVDTMKLLLDRGADMEARTAEGSTALTIAAYNGRQDAATWLVGQGANIDYAIAMKEQDVKKRGSAKQQAALETLRKIKQTDPAGQKSLPAEVKEASSPAGVSAAPLESEGPPQDGSLGFNLQGCKRGLCPGFDAHPGQ
jgi:ankyrin repeat protein